MSDGIWKPVVGYEGLYEVSSLGGVKSLARPRAHGIRYSEHVMAASKQQSGYRTVYLSNADGGKSVYLHRVVAAAFLPNPGGKPEVNHIDSDRSNNAVVNLEWATSLENSRHRHSKCGTMSVGRAAIIRGMHKSGEYLQIELAVIFSRSTATINRIVAGRRWAANPASYVA